MIDFQDFQNHGFGLVAARAYKEFIALKSHQHYLNDVQEALGMYSIDIKCIKLILAYVGEF